MISRQSAHKGGKVVSPRQSCLEIILPDISTTVLSRQSITAKGKILFYG